MTKNKTNGICPECNYLNCICRSLNYEKKFKSYIFNGGFDRFFDICENIGILTNINAINNKIKEKGGIK